MDDGAQAQRDLPEVKRITAGFFQKLRLWSGFVAGDPSHRWRGARSASTASCRSFPVRARLLPSNTSTRADPRRNHQPSDHVQVRSRSHLRCVYPGSTKDCHHTKLIRLFCRSTARSGALGLQVVERKTLPTATPWPPSIPATLRRFPVLEYRPSDRVPARKSNRLWRLPLSSP